MPVSGQSPLFTIKHSIDKSSSAALHRQVRRSLVHVDRVARGLGTPKRILHLGVYCEIPPGRLAGGAPEAAEIAALGRATVPAILWQGSTTCPIPICVSRLKPLSNLSGSEGLRRAIV